MAARNRRKRNAAEGTVQAGAIGGCRRGGECGDCAASEVGMSCNRRALELLARGLFAFPPKWRYFLIILFLLIPRIILKFEIL
jgi:hypothetical protein